MWALLTVVILSEAKDLREEGFSVQCSVFSGQWSVFRRWFTVIPAEAGIQEIKGVRYKT